MKNPLFRTMAIFLALIMFLSGCSGAANTPTSSGTLVSTPPAGTSPAASNSSSAAAVEDVELLLWLTGPLFEDFLEQVIPVFEEQNPGITVKAETIDWGGYQQKILTAVAGGIAPDVISVFATDMAPFVEKNVFKKLDDMVDTSAFIPNYLEAGRWNDGLYTLPIAMTVRPLYYRKDLLKEAGYDNPPQTWEEFRDVAKTLTITTAQGNLERVGFWVPTNHAYKTHQVWLAFLQNNGGKVIDENGDIAFDSPEAIEAAQFFQDLVQVDKVDIPGTITTDDKDLTQGKVAMLLSNSAIRGLPADFVENVGVALPPYNKTPIVEAAGEVVGITSTCKNPEAAAKLLMFLTTDIETSVLYSKLEGGYPATVAAQDTDYVKSNQLLTDMMKMGNDYGIPLPKHPQWIEINGILTSALDKIIIEGASPEATLKEAADRARNLN